MQLICGDEANACLLRTLVASTHDLEMRFVVDSPLRLICGDEANACLLRCLLDQRRSLSPAIESPISILRLPSC